MKTLIATGCAVGLLVAGEAAAQVVSYVTPTTTYYAPAPAVVGPATVATPVPALPATPAPTVTYYAPPAVVAPAPAPTVTYYAPPATVAPAPAPVVTYYRAPTVTYQPVNRVITRYRPLLGGTVTYVRPTYVPVTTF